MFGDEPDSLFGDGLFVLGGENEGAVAQEEVFRFRRSCFRVANAAQKVAALVVNRHWNNQTGSRGNRIGIIWFPVALRGPGHAEWSQDRGRFHIQTGRCYEVLNISIIVFSRSDLNFTQNIFKLLKSEGVTRSHGSPLSLALSNKLLNIHFELLFESDFSSGRLFCTMFTIESIIIDMAMGTEETEV